MTRDPNPSQASDAAGSSGVISNGQVARDMAGTYLDEIIARHRESAERDVRDLSALAQQALRARRGSRSFRAALLAARRAGDRPAVIAEVKRATPSKGKLVASLDPATLASQYADGGAAALSVLTDEAHFKGSAEDLKRARAASGLPVLRKDFTVSVADVYDAAIMGADAILLIAAVLVDDELQQFAAVARELNLDVLYEAHTTEELARCQEAGADLIGINQRNLQTFHCDPEAACAVASAVHPEDVVMVAESGIRGEGDAARFAAAGHTAVLVGETLVKSSDPAKAIRGLRQAGSDRVPASQSGAARTTSVGSA